MGRSQESEAGLNFAPPTVEPLFRGGSGGGSRITGEEKPSGVEPRDAPPIPKRRQRQQHYRRREGGVSGGGTNQSPAHRNIAMDVCFSKMNIFFKLLYILRAHHIQFSNDGAAIPMGRYHIVQCGASDRRKCSFPSM